MSFEDREQRSEAESDQVDSDFLSTVGSDSKNAGLPVDSGPLPGRDADRQFNVSDRFGRLHPMSLFFDITSHIRTLIIPAVIAVLSAASGSGTGLFIAAVIFVPTLLRSIVRYFSLKYRIRNRELVVTEGIFFQRNRTVPVGRLGA